MSVPSPPFVKERQPEWRTRRSQILNEPTLSPLRDGVRRGLLRRLSLFSLGNENLPQSSANVNLCVPLLRNSITSVPRHFPFLSTEWIRPRERPTQKTLWTWAL